MVKTCRVLTLRYVSSVLSSVTPEKHFCLINTSFYIFSVHVFLHLYLTRFWKQVIKKKKNLLIEFFWYCRWQWTVTKLALNNQSLGVFFCLFFHAHPVSQVFNFPFWMSCRDFTSLTVYCLFFSRWTGTITFTPAPRGAANFLQKYIQS